MRKRGELRCLTSNNSAASSALLACHRVVGPGEVSIVDDHYGRTRPTTPARAIRPKTTPRRRSARWVRSPSRSWPAPPRQGRPGWALNSASCSPRATPTAGPPALLEALTRASAFGRWRAEDVRSILANGHAAPTPHPAGDALVVALPAVPTRSLSDYAIAPSGDASCSPRCAAWPPKSWSPPAPNVGTPKNPSGPWSRPRSPRERHPTPLTAAASPSSRSRSPSTSSTSRSPAFRATFGYLASLEWIRGAEKSRWSYPRNRQVPPVRARARRGRGGHRVCYFTAADFVESLYRGLADNSAGRLIDQTLRHDLITNSWFPVGGQLKVPGCFGCVDPDRARGPRRAQDHGDHGVARLDKDELPRPARAGPPLSPQTSSGSAPRSSREKRCADTGSGTRRRAYRNHRRANGFSTALVEYGAQARSR